MTFENGSTQSAVCQVVSMADYVAEKSGGYDLEDGHTRIINTLLDALASAPLTARQYRVLIAIIRKTYGYQKKADRLSVSQLAECTGIHQRHISTTLAELVAMRLAHLLGVIAIFVCLLIAVVAEFAERKQRAERGEYERVLIGEISPAPIVDSKRRGLHTHD